MGRVYDGPPDAEVNRYNNPSIFEGAWKLLGSLAASFVMGSKVPPPKDTAPTPEEGLPTRIYGPSRRL